MLPIVYLNGAYLPREAAQLNVADLAILRGFGIFDFFRYLNGKPHFIEDHLDRFYRSAASLDLKIPVDRTELKAVVMELIRRNGKADGGIRFVLTGGYSPDGYTPGTPNLVAMAYPFAWPPAELYTQGCKVLIHPFERQMPSVKSIDYLEGIRIQPMLRAQGYDYALYLDREGMVRESDRSNYFIVKENTLITPAEAVLHGITRLHLLRLAHHLSLPTEERPVTLAEVLSADEAIICSSAKGAMPITSINGAPVGDGQPGPFTRQLMAAWPRYLADFA
ncbi:aminotransferase class IV [Neolewinella lacunae]|uniref:branched-chain-amino-acid transaminase n=1 Tax=Neolewinella lacunae TaxID=1517758 RepID=A0A923PKH8_9BACT|nr:aminotransferase class IV [Neolewinella lacunae]MBC6992883.1 aminotransferase class IV [Neolewinella lacunae]MDN3633753.1 aminotransferase class IV [Neolewinella lacunae]